MARVQGQVTKLRSPRLAILLLLLLPACGSLPETRQALTPGGTSAATGPSPAATVMPSPSAIPVTPDSGWQGLRPGLERRTINVLDDEGTWQENVTILRLEPDRFRFEVAYRPGDARSLVTWQEETGALLVVNGGFFTAEHLATGIVVAGGQAQGISYEGFGGMLAVTEQGPALRWLRAEPYREEERLLFALQSFPMLVVPGGAAAPTEDGGDRARRTVVAQDEGGRMLFLVANRGHFTLRMLGDFLAASDLHLDAALNLDGGTSSGLLLADPALHVPALVPLPTVITVYPR